MVSIVSVSPEAHGNLAGFSPDEFRLIDRMEQAQNLLAEANDDFIRLRVRDEAAVIAAAAAVLNLSEVQVTASHLVQRAERALAFANEPVLQEFLYSNGRVHHRYAIPSPDPAVLSQHRRFSTPEQYRALIKNVRGVHTKISDAEFESACSVSAQAGTPLSRTILYEMARSLKQQPYPADRTGNFAPTPAAESSPAEIQERLATAEERRQQAEAELAQERERAARLELEQEKWRKYQGENADYDTLPAWRETFTDADSLNKANALRERRQAEVEAETVPVPEPPPLSPGQAVVTPHLSHGGANESWYTPDNCIAAARAVMGGIELDPATSVGAQQSIQADRFFSLEDDGLAQEWQAQSLWLNPPYTRGVVDAFAQKLAAAYERGEVKSAIWLSNNATDTAWFHRLAAVSAAVFFPAGRLDFWYLNAAGEREYGSPLQGQVLIYLGDNPAGFVAAFTAAVGGVGFCHCGG